jgi:DNA-directed RNA polymerase subunit RPC12/RpoP
MEKGNAVWQSYNSHDCETFYKCSLCNKVFGDWDVFHQIKNENGTKHYCPYCKKELNGLEGIKD